jgi:hypothetical protein
LGKCRRGDGSSGEQDGETTHLISPILA